MLINVNITQPINNGPQDVPRTSPPMSPGRPIKILFDHPGDVPIWRPRDVLIWRPGDVLKWGPGDVLIWRLRDVPGSLIRDVPQRNLRVLKLVCLIFFSTFLSELIRLTKSKSISTLKEYWESSKTSKMEHFLQN